MSRSALRIERARVELQCRFDHAIARSDFGFIREPYVVATSRDVLEADTLMTAKTLDIWAEELQIPSVLHRGFVFYIVPSFNVRDLSLLPYPLKGAGK